MEILSKFGDAILMFWQALDDQERRMLFAAVGWVVLLAASRRVEERRQAVERELLADAVARRILTSGGAE